MITKNKSILITGATGSFGKCFIKEVLKKKYNFKRIIIFSRDELKQFQMEKEFSIKQYKSLRYFIGDIRDKDRLKFAFEDVDIVIHAAALKQVPAAEYNPTEFIETNILGAKNIIEASLEKKVKKVIALSTDKAVSPVNLYGATKLCSDKLFISANNFTGKKDISFSVVRYGNVLGSRGSVVPFFKSLNGKNFFPITDLNMTRFSLTIDQCVIFVIKYINMAIGGEIFVPKIPSYKIKDVAKAINPHAKLKIIGIRPGEKIHEDLISINDSRNTVEAKDFYLILPNKNHKFFKKYRKVKNNFFYNSSSNKSFLSVASLRKLIKKI
jgi:UDP-N-acetylglucosamine 4,6-dehydratase